MIHKLLVDTKKYTTKPKDPSVITKRIINNIQELDIYQLASVCLKYTVKPSYLTNTKMSSFVSSSLIVLDIDNCYPRSKDKLTIEDGYMSINDLKQRCIELQIQPALIYHSYSSTDSHERYRVVFQLDKLVTSYNEIDMYYDIVKTKIGPACDMSIKANSLNYPGKEIVLVNDTYVNTLNIALLAQTPHGLGSNNKCASATSVEIPTSVEAQTPHGLHKNTQQNVLNSSNCNGLEDSEAIHIKNPYINTKVILCASHKSTKQYTSTEVFAMVDKNLNDKSLFKMYSNKTFNTMQLLKKHIKQIPLNMLLSVEYNMDTHCLFHKDEKPSVSIYKTEKDYWYYKCHSCGKHIDIIDILAEIYNIDTSNRHYTMKVIKLVMKKLKLRVKNSEWYISESELLKDNKYLLLDEMEVIKLKYPNVYKKLNESLSLLLLMINIAEKQLDMLKLSDVDYKHGIIFKMSGSYASNFLKMHRTTVLRKLDDLMVMGLITKLSDEQLKGMNMSAYISSIKFATKTEEKYIKTIQAYTISNWDDNLLQQAELTLLKLKSLGVTKKGASKRQFEAVGCNTRLKSDADANIKNSILYKWAKRTYDRKGYFLKEDFLNYANKNKIGKQYAETYIVGIVVELGLVRVLSTKELQKKYNLPKSSTRKVAFVSSKD